MVVFEAKDQAERWAGSGSGPKARQEQGKVRLCGKSKTLRRWSGVEWSGGSGGAMRCGAVRCG